MTTQRILLFTVAFFYCISSKAQTAGHTYEIANGKLKMLLDCSNGAVVKSMSVGDDQVVNAPDGMYTSVTVAGKKYSSLQLLEKPEVRQESSSVTVDNIKYGDAGFTVSERWLFAKENGHITWNIKRSFSKIIPLAASASPVINFKSIKIWDGALQGYGGLAWFYLFTDKPSSYGVHSTSSSFWKKDSKNGLDVTVKSAGNQVGMTYKRMADDRLSYTISVSSKNIVPLMDDDTHRRLFIRGDGEVWDNLDAGSGSLDQQITFTYADNEARYNRGTMPGVNGSQVSAVLNTIARIGVIDSLHFGGNSWATPYGPICVHEQYIAQLGVGINDERYLEGYKSCLDFYRDHAFKDDGRVYSRWAYTNEDAGPGQFNKYGFYEAQWGTLMDSNPDYVSNVAELYDLTGDTKWVSGQQKACETALDWILARDSNHNGLVEMMNGNQSEKKSSDWIDIVWAAYENAFVNAKLYHALVKWATIEQVLGNKTKAEYYAGFAAKLKANFNKPTTQGGLWDDSKKCYVHWRDNKNEVHGLNMVTPVNFMAIAYGICDQPDRQKAILDAIENQMQQEKLFFWPLTMTSYQPGEAKASQFPFPSYENGDLFLSWGSTGVAAYAKYQPATALKYVRNVLQQYGKDGLAYQRYSRVDQQGKGDDILAGNSLSIVGLYQSIYGVNPLYNRLLLNPHLVPELNGTSLNYHYHHQLLKIDLSVNNYAITSGWFKLGANHAFGFSATGKEFCYFDKESAQASMQIQPSGKLSVIVNAWNDQQKVWIATGDANSTTTYIISRLKPNSTYALSINGKPATLQHSNSNGTIRLVRKTSGPTEKISLSYNAKR